MTIPEAFAVLCVTTLLGYALVRFIFWCAENNPPRDNIDAERDSR